MGQAPHAYGVTIHALGSLLPCLPAFPFLSSNFTRTLSPHPPFPTRTVTEE